MSTDSAVCVYVVVFLLSVLCCVCVFFKMNFDYERKAGFGVRLMCVGERMCVKEGVKGCERMRKKDKRVIWRKRDEYREEWDWGRKEDGEVFFF